MTTYDLNTLFGGRYHQYANSAGQSYYYDNQTKQTSYSIPPGFEDYPLNDWALDASKSWPQWNNKRTGRASLLNPKPPPPQTYLNDDNVKAAINLLKKVPKSNKHVYRRPTGAVLRFLFPAADGFDVVQETEQDNTRSDFTVFKVLRRPGGTLYQYDYLLAESKPIEESWRTTEIQHREQLAGTGNNSKKCYGMI